MTSLQIPSGNALSKSAEMSMTLDKPICLDYYVASCRKECKIARDGESGDKFLYKSQEEYTSPLKSMFKINSEQNNSCDFILESQNSIYIVNGAML
tara:strand:- start:771 stop:1058 length:288 start_codon:yes stop_codon:yes gene_type:complete